MDKRIAILEGDGIGPEIMAEAVKMLSAVEKRYGHTFELVYVPFGGKAYLDHGHPFPEESQNICDECDAILKGPVGLGMEKTKGIPTNLLPEEAIHMLRRKYDTYANFRPVYLPKDLAEFSLLKNIGDGIDIMIIRELVGGIYLGNKEEMESTCYRYASDDCKYSYGEIDRFADVCFTEAKQRKSRLTIVHKANVLATSRLWNHVFEHVSKQYPSVKTKYMLVDNVAFQLVKNPTQFNGVMAIENMQGDIISDLAGGVIGSLGLMPSAALNMETEKGYYEPSHGSAPDIAGQKIANPYSMIGCVALMLEKSFGLEEEAQSVWKAMTSALISGKRTKDLGGKCTTKQFGNAVVKNLG